MTDAISVLAYIAGITCFSTYAHLSRTGRITPYHIANFFGGIVFIVYNIMIDAYPNLVIEVPYTIVAGWALLRIRRKAHG